MKKPSLLLSVMVSLVTMTCTQKPTSQLSSTPFGEVNGQQATLYTLSFENGLQASVTNYGGIVTSLSVPDKNGKIVDVVLGYDQLQGYLDSSPYFGALIGRYGNRIARGKFTLNGQEHVLAVNNGVNHLHGGEKGFDKVIWEVPETYRTNDSIGITFKYVSADGEEGYTGTLTSIVTYTFTPDAFQIDYEATTDQPTIINLTQHTYFNLSGDEHEDILGHELSLKATSFLPVDSTLIPTGELRPVEGTPFDFTAAKKIGTDINKDNQQLQYGQGYDHCWVLDGGITPKPRAVATLYHPGSGRFMEVLTTEPGMQFYSGNFLNGTITGKNDVVYNQRYGLCLETQHFPDSPNQSAFPSVVLEPGNTYKSSTVYRFSVK